MSYQSLLFCPDEKTARTVTQVLTELDFAVEPCSEPFAAVKKLMGEHFDAIVVDCDNEQNATLLFKGARNSTSNQASLAVAVVEGQAGVAKAFRIGANLVLTKPINVEQAKGTLRVARGLLRKGEAAKPVHAAETIPVPTAPLKKTGHEGPVPVKPEVQTPSSEASLAHPAASPAPWKNPEPTHFSSSVASSTPAVQDQDVLDIDGEDAGTAPALTAGLSPVDSKPAVRNVPVAPNFKALAPPDSPGSFSIEAKAPSPELKAPALPKTNSSAGKAAFGAGAASAPAPARSVSRSAVVEPASSKDKETGGEEGIVERTGKSGAYESIVPVASPSLTFGGAAEPSRGSGKKGLVGIAAAVVLAAGLYIGWSHFHARALGVSRDQGSTAAALDVASHGIAAQPAESDPAAPSSTSTAMSSSMPPTTLPPKTSVKSASATTVAERSDTFNKNTEPRTKRSPKVSDSVPAAKPAPEFNPGAEPIVVKKAEISPSKAKTIDTPAPSVMVAATGAGGSLPNLIGDPGVSAKPVLQTLNVSQGVSQGLLIKKVQPNYPANALRMHVEGPVQLLATIGKTGNITAVKTLSGEPTLVRAAQDAVKQWKYKPYYLNGEPVEIQTQITVNFKLPH